MKSLHTCSLPTCGNLIPTERLMCAAHWRRVPPALQSEVYGAYDAWRCGELSAEDLREVQYRATAAVVEQIAVRVVVPPLGGIPPCPKCGGEMTGGAPHGPWPVQWECRRCGTIVVPPSSSAVVKGGVA